MPLLRNSQKFQNRSNSIRKAKDRDSFDKVRNYKSKVFKDSQPVYGAIDAFNRQVLRHAHEEIGSGLGAKNLAALPISKHNTVVDQGYQTFYPSLIKKPRERLKEEIKNMIVFRRTFGNSFK